ncbi:MAG: acetyl-CoA carboxylase biotin carboxyl carrier protein subunit [Azospirillum sp.]|nr:acetyl-CoA carboxylase biotin carboxyl carrier protein subunit [Azospirillum sp.]
MKLQIGIDGKSYELDVEILQEDKPQRNVGYVPPYAPPITLRGVTGGTPPTPEAAPAAEGTVDENMVCRSPVAGVVVRIKAEAGQELQPDDLIMVLEAMKMETNVTAAHAGKVKAIKVAEGDGVKVNQVLMEFA